MSNSTERARKHREEQKAKGLVWRGLWVHPAIWGRVREYVNRLNRQELRKDQEGKDGKP